MDDHILVRDAIADLVNSIPGFQVVLRAGNGLEYLAAMEQCIEVAVAVVDLRMPYMDGYETIHWIQTNRPGTRALAISVETSKIATVRARRCGAVGFIRKHAQKAEFMHALTVAASAREREGIIADLWPAETEDDAHGVTPLPKSEPRSLTDREIRFTQLACHEDELTYDQIAMRMGVHRRTVDGYRASVFQKLGIHSKAGLVLKAVRQGWIG